MSEPKHTPGPWSWHGVFLEGPNHQVLKVEDTYIFQPDKALIVAAPELYAALKARDVLEAHCADYEHAHAKVEVDEWFAVLEELQREERELRAAALAKAEGREVQP